MTLLDAAKAFLSAYDGSHASPQYWNALRAAVQAEEARGEKPDFWLVAGSVFPDEQRAKDHRECLAYLAPQGLIAEVIPLYRRPQAEEAGDILDAPEDRLYHAADRTWWRREADGRLVSAEAPGDAADKLKILKLVTKEPGLDDVDLADRLGLVPFRVSVLLRELESDGLIDEHRAGAEEVRLINVFRPNLMANDVDAVNLQQARFMLHVMKGYIVEMDRARRAKEGG